jgi:hypothetical protein
MIKSVYLKNSLDSGLAPAAISMGTARAPEAAAEALLCFQGEAARLPAGAILLGGAVVPRGFHSSILAGAAAVFADRVLARGQRNIPMRRFAPDWVVLAREMRDGEFIAVRCLLGLLTFQKSFAA